jgi:plasmid stabilization system protein ParE
MRVSLSDEAQADIDAAVDWYIGENAFIAADDFVDELDRALGLLSRFPGLGETGARNTRTFPLHSFPIR